VVAGTPTVGFIFVLARPHTLDRSCAGSGFLGFRSTLARHAGTLSFADTGSSAGGGQASPFSVATGWSPAVSSAGQAANRFHYHNRLALFHSGSMDRAPAAGIPTFGCTSSITRQHSHNGGRRSVGGRGGSGLLGRNPCFAATPRVYGSGTTPFGYMPSFAGHPSPTATHGVKAVRGGGGKSSNRYHGIAPHLPDQQGGTQVIDFRALFAAGMLRGVGRHN